MVQTVAWGGRGGTGGPHVGGGRPGGRSVGGGGGGLTEDMLRGVEEQAQETRIKS